MVGRKEHLVFFFWSVEKREREREKKNNEVVVGGLPIGLKTDGKNPVPTRTVFYI